MADIIERFSAKNYGCLKDVSVALTPLHAFIGPNDSGKSTLLWGIRTITEFARGTCYIDGAGVWRPFDPGMAAGIAPLEAPSQIEVTVRDLAYRVGYWGVDPETRQRPGRLQEELFVRGNPLALWRRDPRIAGLGLASMGDDIAKTLKDPSYTLDASITQFLWQGARLLRLDPDSMRAPSGLKTSGTIDFEDDTGRGLPGIYDVILNRHMDGFVEIRDHLRRLFPSVRTLGLENMSPSTKEIRIQITSGEWIPAQFLSEGMLYYLAFEAIRFLSPRASIDHGEAQTFRGACPGTSAVTTEGLPT